MISHDGMNKETAPPFFSLKRKTEIRIRLPYPSQMNRTIKPQTHLVRERHRRISGSVVKREAQPIHSSLHWQLQVRAEGGQRACVLGAGFKGRISGPSLQDGRS